jgi:hypothetical protein
MNYNTLTVNVTLSGRAEPIGPRDLQASEEIVSNEVSKLALCYTTVCRFSCGKIVASLQEAKYGPKQAAAPTDGGPEVLDLLETHGTNGPVGAIPRGYQITLQERGASEEIVESSPLAGLKTGPATAQA